MRHDGNHYALAALKRKRALIAAEIVQLERQLRHRWESLVHVDTSLRLLDPAIGRRTGASNHQSGTISGVATAYQRHDFFSERRDVLDRCGST